MPPADAKLAKALMLGISTLSTTNRFSRAAAADDDVVAEVVGADHDARQALHVARHVLQGRGALEDLARLHQEARVLHRLGRLDAGAVTVTVCWKSSTVGSVISTVPSSPARTSTGRW